MAQNENKKGMEKNWNFDTVYRLFFFLFVFFSFFSCVHAVTEFQMEWGNSTALNETWITVNLSAFFVDPIIVATPQYTTTTNANGISTWITNITNTSFRLRVSDENFAAADNVLVTYIVLERGNWTLPNSGIKVEANSVSTTKYGYQGAYTNCPSGGETISFSQSFNSNPLVLSVRASDNNPSVWAATIQSETTSTATVGTSAMCIRLSRSRAGTATFTNLERINWIAVDEGNGTLNGSEYEILWNLADTGDSGGNWINGYGDAKPFSQSWAHTWSGGPNYIIGGQTSISGSDGSWPVIYDTGNTGSIRMFVDESNERSHSGSESGGGWAFNSSGYYETSPYVFWDSSSFYIGGQTVDEGNISSNLSIESYKFNDGISISCDSGNCSTITTNWTSTNLLHGEQANVSFTCNDSVVGAFWALYNVTSLNTTRVEQINVSCQIYKVYGTLNVSLITPSTSFVTPIHENRSFTMSVNITCSGEDNTSCGEVFAIARYNGSSDFGTGADGALTVSSTNTIVNKYTYLSTNANGGTSTLQVNSSADFSVGDEILIIQMQNGTGTFVAGQYQFANIKNIASNTIEIEKTLDYDFGTGTFNTSTSTATQIVRVPQFTDLTINSGASLTAPSWNGYVGGIVVMRVSGTLNTTGYINVSEKGYRGGSCINCGNNDQGEQGESYLGLGTLSTSARANGGGGGYGPSGYNGDPGGGGGYATSGGIGDSNEGNDAGAGASVGDSNLSVILFGGGAGAGGDNDGQTPYPEYSSGGGIALIFAQEMPNARILAEGETGVSAAASGAGTSGSGAGGTVWIRSQDITISKINASGGRSVTGTAGDIGGAGGDGRVRIDSSSLSGSATPAALTNTLLITETMKEISTVSPSYPLYTTSSQPQSCGELNRSQNCTLSWTVNATGPANQTVLVDVLVYSNYSRVPENKTLNATMNISSNTVPIIDLLSPLNNEKVMSNGNLSLSFNISDDDSNVSCIFILDGVSNQSFSCVTGTPVITNVSLLSRGLHNWSVNVTDSEGNNVSSQTYNFTIILQSAAKVTKTVSSIASSQYLAQIFVEKSDVNATEIYSLYDFVDSSFSYGSFTPPFDVSASITGPPWFGDVLLWNETTVSTGLHFNYSLAGLGTNFSLLKTYLVGLE
ncbi:hypothetical protein H6501_03000 [Candidatus Woesearchaeota archaeon]|nr:hypothetical protein [Nanoarchaeota archaeon]MCB9370538.1 hypothetical protein [Candidatus Woesearchaeota archaeon]